MSLYRLFITLLGGILTSCSAYDLNAEDGCDTVMTSIDVLEDFINTTHCGYLSKYNGTDLADPFLNKEDCYTDLESGTGLLISGKTKSPDILTNGTSS